MTLQKLLNELCQSDFDFHVHSYSGRGMYGKTCLAITGNDINLLALGMSLGAEDDLYENILGYKTDSMGRGIVIYWPNIPFDENEGEDEKEVDTD